MSVPDHSLLEEFYDGTHRSRRILEVGTADVACLRPRNHYLPIEMYYDERYSPFFHRAGLLPFVTVARRNAASFNHASLTALVDRWRPKTHAFHLPSGEMTVTLQDVAMILGLPIAGRAITGIVDSKGWRTRVEELLGAAPPERAEGEASRKMNGVPYQWLQTRFGVPPPANADVAIVEQYAHAYGLYVLAGSLFPDASGDTASWMWLPLLSDWDEAGQLSWGSAALAWLYRQLCDACRRQAKNQPNLGGCMILLQIWMWLLIPVGRCVGNVPAVDGFDHYFEGELQKPTVAHLFEVVLGHAGQKVKMYKECTNQLDLLLDGEIEWEPYKLKCILELELNPMCRRNESHWRKRCPLVCFYAVELHMTHRVMRQFGLLQTILEMISTSVDLHKKSRTTTKKITDWRQEHHAYIRDWDDAVDMLSLAARPHNRAGFDLYLDWLHDKKTRLRLQPAWTLADITEHGTDPKSREYEPDVRLQASIEVGRMCHTVADEVVTAINEASVILKQPVDGENTDAYFRQYIQRTRRRLKCVARLLGCRPVLIDDPQSPAEASRGSSSENGEDSGENGEEDDEYAPEQAQASQQAQSPPRRTRQRKAIDRHTPGSRALGAGKKRKAR